MIAVWIAVAAALPVAALAALLRPRRRAAHAGTATTSGRARQEARRRHGRGPFGADGRSGARRARAGRDLDACSPRAARAYLLALPHARHARADPGPLH